VAREESVELNFTRVFYERAFLKLSVASILAPDMKNLDASDLQEDDTVTIFD